jgi:7-keto-8-aminopelargonate synthetase-like enzyme
VPVGTERLRICLHTFNTRDEIVSLVDKLGNLAPTP